MMDALGPFHFIRPWALGLIPLAVFFWWLFWRSSDSMRGWRVQMDAELLKALTVGEGGARSAASVGLLIAWILASAAAAGPTWRHEPSPFADDASPLMLLLKADASMETGDPEPSRMEIARLKIADLAEARKGQPLGLIAYAGSAHLVLPPTRDTEVVATMAAEISPEIMPVQGDRLDLAIQKAAESLGGGAGTLMAFADTIDSDAEPVGAALDRAGASLAILAVNNNADELASLRDIAEQAGATVQPLTPDDGDVSALVRAASRPPEARSGEDGARWQEAGYWLVPVIALFVALSFRRKDETSEAAS